MRTFLEVAVAVVIYLFGSNNPWPSVKAKIITKAKAAAGAAVKEVI